MKEKIDNLINSQKDLNLDLKYIILNKTSLKEFKKELNCNGKLINYQGLLVIIGENLINEEVIVI